MKNSPVATQKELAKRIGISESHMSLIISGKRLPSLTVAKRMAAVLGTTVDLLFKSGVELCEKKSEKKS